MPDEMQKLIAADLGISELSVAEQQELIASFGEVALKAATVAILEKVPEGKRDEFTKIAEGGDAGAMQTFLDAEVPEHETLAKQAVAAEIDRFKSSRAA